MDKIFKNDTIMGVMILITFLLVVWSSYNSYKTKKSIDSAEESMPATE